MSLEAMNMVLVMLCKLYFHFEILQNKLERKRLAYIYPLIETDFSMDARQHIQSFMYSERLIRMHNNSIELVGSNLD